MYAEFFAELDKATKSAELAQQHYENNLGDDALNDIDNALEAGSAGGYLAGLEVAYMMLTGNSLEREVN